MREDWRLKLGLSIILLLVIMAVILWVF